MKLVNVMASSLDGLIAASKIEGDIERQSIGLSSEVDQVHLRREISESDAIIVGASSIRANQECLAHPMASGKMPTWYVIARNEIPKSYKFWQQDDIPRVILTEQPMKVFSDRVRLVVMPNLKAESIYQLVKGDGAKRCLLFGGGIINSWFYEEKLVDELVLTLAPIYLAQSQAPQLIQASLTEPVTFDLLSSHVEGNFVFLKYAVRNSNRHS